MGNLSVWYYHLLHVAIFRKHIKMPQERRILFIYLFKERQRERGREEKG